MPSEALAYDVTILQRMEPKECTYNDDNIIVPSYSTP